MGHGLLTVTFAVSLLGRALAHSWCGHDDARRTAEAYNAQEATGANARRKADARARFAGASVDQRRLGEAQGSQPLRVVYDYQLLPSTAVELAEYIETRLMPAAAAVLRRSLRVKAYDQYVRLDPMCRRGWYSSSQFISCKEYATPTCVYASVPNDHLNKFAVCPDSAFDCQTYPGGVGAEGDVLFYVTNEDPATCGSRLAAAAACAFHPVTNRPIAGNVILCQISSDNFDSDLATAVHEMLHVLGMDTAMFGGDHFIDAAGELIPQSQITASTVRDGRNVTTVITPKVAAAVQGHFGCSSVQGAELEDDGGAGTAGSHWEQRLFQGEMMDAVGGSNTFSGQHALTDLTLALLEDSGWYSVHYTTAGFNLWGWQGGCEFAAGACTRGGTESGDFYCDMSAPDRTDLCTHDHSSTGLCTQDTHSTFDGCYRVEEYSNAVCVRASTVRPSASTNIDGWYRGPSSRCIQESPGFGRNGFRYMDGAVNAQCYEMVCSGGRLYVVIDHTRLLCPDKGYIDLDRYPELGFVVGSMLGPCPETSLMCGTTLGAKGTLECVGDCSARGVCTQGTCHCHVGYVGATCDRSICWDDAQCGAGQACDPSGECVGPGGATADPTAVPPAEAPPPGFYTYGDWSECPEACTGGTVATRTRNVTCGGDCSTLAPPVTIAACPPRPCADTACSVEPCGADNICSAQDVDGAAEVTCLCTSGTSGELCQADAAGCHLDGDGECCPAERAVAITGECCAASMALDHEGRCCLEAQLDACGVCGGQTLLVDTRGTCCPVTTVDADGACCVDAVDVCGVCNGTGTSCLAQFLLACTVDPYAGTTADLVASASVLAELADVITAALDVPARVIDDITLLLPAGNSSRRMLQAGDLHIRLRLRQDEASQPLASRSLASLIQSAVEQAAFTDMNVTAVLSAEPSYEPDCGNGVCEGDEAAAGSLAACPGDCASSGSCASPPLDAAVGALGEPCGGLGRCNAATGVCACSLGHVGEACAECEYGFTPRGAECAPTRVRFEEEEDVEADLMPMQRILLIVGAGLGVTGVVAIVIAVWCCLSRRAVARAAQIQMSPGAASALFR
eukprot:jgi/Ulvmu1/546/UM001_0554.1